MTIQDVVTKIADAIARQEGFHDPRSRAARNHNPGNIWDGLCTGKSKRIWPQYPIDLTGFLILPDNATGRALMEKQIRLKISRNETLRTLINQWDSSDKKVVRDLYVQHVAEWTGLPIDDVLADLFKMETLSSIGKPLYES